MATPQLDAVVFQMTDAIGRRELRQGGGGAGELLHMQEAPIKLLAVLGSSSASSTPPAWPSSTERACPTSWSCGACARPTRRSGSCSPPALFPALVPPAVLRCGQTDLAMKSTGADGEELLIGLLMELAVKKGA